MEMSLDLRINILIYPNRPEIHTVNALYVIEALYIYYAIGG